MMGPGDQHIMAAILARANRTCRFLEHEWGTRVSPLATATWMILNHRSGAGGLVSLSMQEAVAAFGSGPRTTEATLTAIDELILAGLLNPAGYKSVSQAAGPFEFVFRVVAPDPDLDDENAESHSG